MNQLQRITQQTALPYKSVEATVHLLEQDATVPFIARYRKGQTGGLDEEQIRAVQKALAYFKDLEARKATIIKAIEEQGKLTPELRKQIDATDDATALEDLYLPYKAKRKTKATIAREQGLEPLAKLMTTAREGNKTQLLRPFQTGEVYTKKEALQGAQYILAEALAERAELRAHLRKHILQRGYLAAKRRATEHKDAHKFDTYEDFAQPIGRIRPHQVLAINRGESLKILSVSLDYEQEYIEGHMLRQAGWGKQLLFFDELQEAAHMALTRYLGPSIEREVRKQLNATADKHAIAVFAENLKNLLLQPPLLGHVVLGADPGFASGCKLAVVDEAGTYLAGTVIYPTPPRKQTAQAEAETLKLIRKHGVTLIAIGNGTASRETEQFIASLIQKHKLDAKYLIANEAGASVYSASPLAKKEFPQLDASERGNISIARRVLDPLAELVKIPPQSLGVGLYQHDVDQGELEQELAAVVEHCVNEVGIDLNTASPKLLSFVSGLSERLATEVVAERGRLGSFASREQLLGVRGIGEKVFEQAAGFLRVRKGANPLDDTNIHPEAYQAVQALAKALKLPLSDLPALGKHLQKAPPAEQARLQQSVGIDAPTFALIVENLLKPGRDPREDVPLPILRSDLMNIENLFLGQKLRGTVRNVVDFGAFVDIGLKNDALLHISGMRPPGGERVNSPHDVVSLGDVILVEVSGIDLVNGKVGLTMVHD